MITTEQIDCFDEKYESKITHSLRAGISLLLIRYYFRNMKENTNDPYILY